MNRFLIISLVLLSLLQLRLFNLHCNANRLRNEVLGANEVRAQGFGHTVSFIYGRMWLRWTPPGWGFNKWGG